MKKLLIIAVLAVAGVAQADFPDRTLESAGSATGQNIRISSGANAAGEYGVVVGSNLDAADGTQLFAVCESCDDTEVYVFTITADGNWTLDPTAPLITTTSSAAGLNLGVASGANAAGEYGVVVGTTSTAVITGQGLFAVAADVDGTPVYSVEVQPVSVLGVGAQVLNTSSVAALNLALYSGANAAGEYGVSVGSSAIVTDTTELFGVCSDCDGTEAYVFTVAANDNVLLGASAPLVTTVSASAGLNLGIASGADAPGDYGVVVGSNASVTDGTQLFSVAFDVDGTPINVFTVSANDNVLLGGSAPLVTTSSTVSGVNLVIGSGADAAAEYGVSLGTNATGVDASAPTMPLLSACQDCDGTPEHLFEVRAGGGIFVDGSGTAPTSVSVGSGTAAVTALSVTGQVGGAATTAVGAITGGTGGSVSLFSGAGGATSGASTTNTGGTGGSFEVNLGAGGAASLAATNNGGAGGSVTMTAGAGGTGASTGGGGGSFTLTSGAGAATNGPGGDITLATGGGSGSGADGRILLASVWDQAGQGVRVASGANAATEYGVALGSNAIVSDGTQMLGVCSDCDGTPAYVFTVSADDNVLLGATAPLVTSISTQAGINLVVASGANASGEFAVSLGTTAAAAAGLDLATFGTVLSGTPVHAAIVSTVAADGTGAIFETTASAAGLNLGIASGANASAEFGVVVGTNAPASAGVELLGVASDVDGTPVYAVNFENIAADGSGGAFYNTASAANVNLSIASGADAAGDYGVTVGTTANAADATPIFTVAESISGGTATNVLTVDAAGNIGGLLAGRAVLRICGDGDAVAGSAVFFGPTLAGVESSTTAAPGGCDTTAAGSATEATADAPYFAAQAFQVTGMVCYSDDPAATATFTLRSDLANLTPSVSLTIATGVFRGVADVQTTTAVASGATVAISLNATALPTPYNFICEIAIAY